MKYVDLKIGFIDQEFIDDISYKYDIDYTEADIYEDGGLIANQIIEYILTEAVNKLDISDDNKDYLISKIYCNCFNSGYDISSSDVEDMIDGTEEEKHIIEDFLNL